jgi:hypothetical protein
MEAAAAITPAAYVFVFIAFFFRALSLVIGRYFEAITLSAVGNMLFLMAFSKKRYRRYRRYRCFASGIGVGCPGSTRHR